MRTWFVVLTVVLAITTAASARKEETLDDLKARAESARPEERPGLCIEIARRHLQAADELYTAGKVDPARTAVEDVAVWAEKARDASIQSGKKLKPTEIAVRKMAEKLRDIKRTLNFEDQAPVQAAVDRLENVRTELLAKMFGKGKK